VNGDLVVNVVNVKMYCLQITTNIELFCRNPTLAKCEDETHTPKVGVLEPSRTPKNSELDFRGQNTSHWGVLNIMGKVLKCRCPKWPRMNHLDICSPSYGQKKAGSQIDNLTPNHKKSRIDLISTCDEEVRHGVGKLSRRATRLV
jgi:hypothetical protein